jgi:hypothetical protein
VARSTFCRQKLVFLSNKIPNFPGQIFHRNFRLSPPPSNTLHFCDGLFTAGKIGKNVSVGDDVFAFA